MQVNKETLLDFLKLQDTVKWNTWREHNPELKKIDLSSVDLRGLRLSPIEVCTENPEETGKVFHANLAGINFRGSDLEKCQIPHANLHFADLSNSIFEKAQLTQADFRDGNLSKANFRKADLWKANFCGTELTETNFSEAQLSEANFTESILSRAFLFRADLTEANFTNANLTGALLCGAWLTQANFCGADLRGADLISVHAGGADFTGANLTGACIENWNPDSETKMGQVICDYIYRKADQQERRPSSGKFSPGEFQALFQQAIETVDLIFVDGIDWKAFFQSFQELRSEYNDNISIQAIEKKSDENFVIRLEVPPEAVKAAIESRAKELYERDRQLLEAQYQALLQAKDGQITVYQEWLKAERKDNTDLTGIVKTMAEKDMSKVTQQFNGPVTGVAGNVEGNQNIYSLEQRQTLSEAAKEIQQLLNQLSETYPTTTSTGQMAIATKAVEEIEKNPALKRRVIGALKAGGTEALKELVDHPAVNILLAVLEGWQKPE